MTKKGKGIALLLVIGKSLYTLTSLLNGQANLQKCSTLSRIRKGTLNITSRNTQLYFPPIIPQQISHTKNKSISYHQGRKQEYPISCFLPVFVFVLVHTCRTRRKRAVSRNLKSNLQFGTDCLEPLPGCLLSIALEYSSSTAVKVTNSTGKYLMTVDQILALYTEAAKRGWVTMKECSEGPFKCKGCTPLLPCKRLKQKVQRWAETDHYSTTPFHTTFIIPSTAKVSHIIKVERTLDLMDLFWPSNSWVGLILWRKPENPPAQFKNKPVESYFFKSKSISYHLLSICFSLSWQLNERQGEGEQSTGSRSQTSDPGLLTWKFDCLPCLSPLSADLLARRLGGLLL